MQFSFLGFSVKKIMEFELDVKDLAILRFFQDFMKSGKMNYEEVDGVKYYWISYKNISEEMPFLGLGKRTIMMRMLKLRDLGILSHYTKKEGGTFSYYTLGDKFNDLLYTSENRSLSNIVNESKDSSREISGQSSIKTNSTNGQSSSNINSNDRSEMSRQANNNIKPYIEERVDYVQHSNETSEKSIQVNFEELIKNREDNIDRHESKIREELDYRQAGLGVNNNSINGQAASSGRCSESTIEQSSSSKVNKNSINHKEEDISIPEYTNQTNKDTLSKDMNRGCSSKNTTKTNLLNYLTTINTNDLKSIKDKLEFILNYLNTKANVNYRITNRKTVGLITARLREGFTPEDFKVVIDKKVSEWSGTNFEQYLNPFTLFGDKFELYLNQKVASKKRNANGVVGNSQREKFYKSDTRKLRFHNFTGREVDYDAIENQLLGWE